MVKIDSEAASLWCVHAIVYDQIVIDRDVIHGAARGIAALGKKNPAAIVEYRVICNHVILRKRRLANLDSPTRNS